MCANGQRPLAGKFRWSKEKRDFLPPIQRVKKDRTNMNGIEVEQLDDDGNVVDPAVDHAGQKEIDHAVTARKRDGSHQTFADQFRNERIITVGENDAQRICIGVYHCSSPSFTLLLTMALGPTFALSPI